MKKLSSIIALSLVLTLVLGMTAFAAGDSNKTTGSLVGATENTELAEDWTADDFDAAEEATLVKGQINLTKVKEVAAAAGVEVDTANPKVRYIFELSSPTGKYDTEVTISFPGLVSGKVYVVLHELQGGGYETLPVTLVDGGFKITGLTSYSPFWLVEYSKLETTSDDNDGDGDDEAAPASDTPVSPKTGETVPYAAVVALIALAGASVVVTKRAFAGR